MNVYDRNTAFAEWLSESASLTMTELTSRKCPLEVTHNIYGTGKIKAVFPTNSGALMVTVKFADREITFSYEVVRRLGILNVTADTAKLLSSWLDISAKSFEEKHRLDYEVFLAGYEATKASRRQEKQDENRDKSRAKMIAKLYSMKPEDLPMTATTWEAIGWMAAHVSSVKAIVPDYLESWFTAKFGDAPHTTIDGSKKTAGGHAMKWGPSFKIAFKETIPSYVYEGATGKSIDSVDFVWTLLSRHGFKFGKPQDIDAIKAAVPAEYMGDFLKGYEA